MARRHTVDIELDADRDLTRISCRRVRFECVAPGRYRALSDLKLLACERATFVEKVIRRRLPGLVAYTGNASKPSGYFWSRPKQWAAVR